MHVPEVKPGENVYKYISRVRDELGTDYVYVICGSEVLAPTSANVNVATAKTVLDYARIFTREMPAGLNAVVATLDDSDGNIMVKKIGEGTYLVAFVQNADKTMKIEEVSV